MSVDEEKAKQKSIQEGNQCEHIGYYVGFGLVVVPTQDQKLHCITSQNCMMCGETFIKLAVLNTGTPEPKKTNTFVMPRN